MISREQLTRERLYLAVRTNNERAITAIRVAGITMAMCGGAELISIITATPEVEKVIWGLSGVSIGNVLTAANNAWNNSRLMNKHRKLFNELFVLERRF